MFKSMILSCLLLFSLVKAQGQKHNNQVIINGQASIPSGQLRPGLGGFLEGLYGTGKLAQLSFTAGVFVFHGRPRYKPNTVTTAIPFQIGYKQNFKSFFLQPQAGFGALNGKIDITGDVSKPSVPAFFYGLKLGFGFKKINAGISFQQVQAIRSGERQIWDDKQLNYSGIYVGYIF